MMDRLENPVAWNCRTYRSVLFALLVVASMLPGCGPEDGPNPSSGGEPVSTQELSGDEIWKSTLARYQKAVSYSDEAVLYVSYQLQGNAIQEPKPWAVKFSRDSGLQAELFNSEVHATLDRISCYVYDIASGNLDDQFLVREWDEKRFLGGLTDDPIAMHFLSGANDLPVADGLGHQLMPLTLSLLGAESRHPWLTSPTKVERFQDGQVDEVSCFVVRITGISGGQEVTTDVWIGKQDGLIWQMLLPNEFLTSELNDSPDVQRLQLIVRFNEARFDCSESFLIPKRNSTTMVRKFVKLPDALPSELIGHSVNPFQLLTADRNTITEKDILGKPTLLVWLVGPRRDEIAKKLVDLQHRYPQVDTVVVFSDDSVSLDADRLRIPADLETTLKQANVRWAIDPGLDASAALRVDAVPSLLLVDPQGMVVFGQKLGVSNWEEDLVAAVTRVQAGEDIAQEMLAEYQRHLETYDRRLTEQSIENKMQLAGFGKSTPFRNVATRSLWIQKDFVDAGNIFADGADNEVVVFDGWQSLKRIAMSGRIIEEITLPIPTDFAANRLATGGIGEFAAVYQESGDRIYVLDSNWKKIGSYPGEGDSLGPITDGRFSNSSLLMSNPSAARDSGQQRLIVAFAKSGIHDVDLQSGRGERISETSVTAYAGDLEIGIDQGRLVKLDIAGQTASSVRTESERWRVVADYCDGLIWGVFEDANQTVKAAFLDREGNVGNTVSVQQLTVETDSRILDSIQNGSDRLGAILVSPTHLRLIRNESDVLGDIVTNDPVQGFKLVVIEDHFGILIAGPDGVECLQILGR